MTGRKSWHFMSGAAFSLTGYLPLPAWQNGLSHRLQRADVKGLHKKVGQRVLRHEESKYYIVFVPFRFVLPVPQCHPMPHCLTVARIKASSKSTKSYDFWLFVQQESISRARFIQIPVSLYRQCYMFVEFTFPDQVKLRCFLWQQKDWFLSRVFISLATVWKRQIRIRIWMTMDGKFNIVKGVRKQALTCVYILILAETLTASLRGAMRNHEVPSCCQWQCMQGSFYKWVMFKQYNWWVLHISTNCRFRCSSSKSIIQWKKVNVESWPFSASSSSSWMNWMNREIWCLYKLWTWVKMSSILNVEEVKPAKRIFEYMWRYLSYINIDCKWTQEYWSCKSSF